MIRFKEVPFSDSPVIDLPRTRACDGGTDLGPRNLFTVHGRKAR